MLWLMTLLTPMISHWHSAGTVAREMEKRTAGVSYIVGDADGDRHGRNRYIGNMQRAAYALAPYPTPHTRRAGWRFLVLSKSD